VGILIKIIRLGLLNSESESRS
ncbi:hypothetical protein CCACVL1_18207, partial [Corchorus capsularis]